MKTTSVHGGKTPQGELHVVEHVFDGSPDYDVIDNDDDELIRVPAAICRRP